MIKIFNQEESESGKQEPRKSFEGSPWRKVSTTGRILENIAANRRQPMKSLLPLSAGAVITIALFGCASQQCKIEPPPTVIGTNKEMSTKAAANALASAISGGELSGHYQNTVNNTYQTVGQDDVAFYLLLQAYNCESVRGNAAGAAKILQLAREELARRHDAPPPPKQVAATSKTLTKTEQHVLRKSPLKGAISNKLAEPTAAVSPAPSASPAATPSR